MLRAFLRTAARARSRASRPAQDDDVLLDAPDDRLAPALVAAARGEHAPAAALLAATRENTEWEHRDHYASALAAFARSRAEWLDGWRGAAPDDPDALLVEGRLTVDRHWDSPARAELLRRVAPRSRPPPRPPGAIRCRGGPPWTPRGRPCRARRVRAAVGAGGAPRPAPLRLPRGRPGVPGHGLPGAHRECLEFAETAAQDAPEDSLLRALPLRAAFTFLTANGDGAPAGALRTRLDAAADRAIAVSAAQPPADPWPAGLRNLLAYVLVRLERFPDAAEQLRLTGPYVTSFPWDRDADDPLGRFLQVRADVRAAVASAPGTAGPGGPRNGRGGRVRPDDH